MGLKSFFFFIPYVFQMYLLFSAESFLELYPAAEKKNDTVLMHIHLYLSFTYIHNKYTKREDNLILCMEKRCTGKCLGVIHNVVENPKQQWNKRFLILQINFMYIVHDCIFIMVFL